MENIQTCLNCENKFDDSFEFCPYCGQKTSEDLTIGVLFYNTISNYFSFDARFFKSFIPLMFKPGYLAKKFLQGKRLLFLHPAQMYLFVSVVFFFVLSFNTRELVEKADEINQDIIDVTENNQSSVTRQLDSATVDSILKPIRDNKENLGLEEQNIVLADSILKAESSNQSVADINMGFNKQRIDSLIEAGADESLIYEEMGMSNDASYLERRFFARMLSLIEGKGAGSIVQAFFDSIPISMFLLLPLFALILKVFYFNKGKYAHHLVFSFYLFSFVFMVFTLLFALNRFVYDLPSAIDWLIALSIYFYFLIALIRFYQQNWFLSLIKSGLISFIFLLFVLPSAAGVLIAYSFLFT